MPSRLYGDHYEGDGTTRKRRNPAVGSVLVFQEAERGWGRR
jgi:hypothetical protein